MIQKGSLPLTGQITLHIDTDIFEILDSRLMLEFPINGVLSFPDNPEVSKKKVGIILKKVSRPGTHNVETMTGNIITRAYPQETARGLARSLNYFVDHIFYKNSWLLFGTLKGDNPIPIVVVYNEQLKIGVYSFKKKDETDAEFAARLN